MKKKIFILLFVLICGYTFSQVPGIPIIISPADSSTICPPYIFDWNDVPNATSYHIQISLNVNFYALIIDEVLNISQYTLPSGVLSGSTFYYWHVCAVNSYGSGPSTATRRVKAGTLLNPPALVSPPNGAILPIGNILFSWNPQGGATSYIFQLSKFPTFDSLIVNDTTPLGTIPLVPNTTYYWRMCSIGSPCGTGNWSSVWHFTTVPQPPDPPTLISPPDSSVIPVTGQTFDWNDVPTATSYRIQISTSPTFSTTVVNLSTGTQSQYTHNTPALQSNMLYYWRVNATNSGGSSNWSSVRRVITTSEPLGPPSLIYPPNASVNISLTPTLDWSNSVGATSYRVYVASTPPIDTIVGVSQYTIPSGKLNYNTLYYWRVASINISGQSMFSPFSVFQTVNQSGIKQISSEIPSEYKLYQNYPNPFNPVTNIKYQITNNKYTTVKIFDVLGKEIETLVNEKQSPGTYEVTFDGSNLPSGFYYYTIRAGDFSDTKKMVFIK